MKNSVTVVFGGSGFIGTHLIEYLLDNTSDEVICVDIQKSRLSHDRLTFLAGDVRDLSCTDIKKPVDKIFNLAAVHTTPGHHDYEYYETNISGALEVLAFATRHNCRRVIFTSSISVYGPGEELKDEWSAPRPVSAYGRSKLIAENIHRDWLRQNSNRKLVISRPAVIFGPGENGNFTRLSRMAKAGIFVYPGRTDTIKSCFYVKDLVECLNYTSGIEDSYILFNACYPERYTIRDIVNILKRNHFPRLKTFMMPLSIMMIAAWIAKPFSAAGIGIHPERIFKMVRSTNIDPQWLIQSGLAKWDRLPSALSDWAAQSSGRLD